MYVKDKKRKNFKDPMLLEFWMEEVVVDKFKVNNISKGDNNNNNKNYNKINTNSKSKISSNKKFNKS